MQSTTPSRALSSRTQSSERVSNASPPPLPSATQPKEEPERPEHHRRRSVVIEDPDDDVQNDTPTDPQQHYSTLPGTPQRTFQEIDAIRTHTSTPSNASSDSAPASAVGVPVIFSQRATSRNDLFPSSPFTSPLKTRPLSDYEEEQVLYPATTARPRTPYASAVQIHDREISWIASPGLP
jgi:serine/arginine repetitive matrix protein 2